MMSDRSLQRRGRGLLAALIALLVVGAAPSVSAHRTELSVEVVSDSSALSPDGRSMSFQIATRCDSKWTVVEATVRVEQSQAWGETSFTPRCARLRYTLHITVPAVQGTFQTGTTQASAVLIVGQGKTKEARDSGSLRARPSVSLQLADEATLLEGGAAVEIDATVTCPRISSALGGSVRVYDGEAVGTGSFGPTPCDASPHTVKVRVDASEGTFRVGSAEAFATTAIEEGGDVFHGVDLRTIAVT